MVESVTKNMTAKAVRMSVVALSAAVMAVFWILLDELANLEPSAGLVSAITALVMLIAQFYDYKATVAGVDLFEGEDG